MQKMGEYTVLHKPGCHLNEVFQNLVVVQALKTSLVELQGIALSIHCNFI